MVTSSEDKQPEDDVMDQEDERHIEITIGDPVADKVIDSCVGTVCILI